MNIALSVKSETTEKISNRHISEALAAYKPNYHLVKAASRANSEHGVFTNVLLDEYPFTVEKMKYCSINLLNLSIEQALIVHLDWDISEGRRSGFWGNLFRFREIISCGCGLVPKLNIRVFDKVDIGSQITLHTKIKQERSKRDSYIFRFEVESIGVLSCSGIGYIIKQL